jgi:CRP-like cAMP-binding protein
MAQASRPPNQFLESLSAADYELLRAQLKSVALEQETILFPAGGEITRAYFPTGGVVSLVVNLTVGETVEAGMIGRDGVVGGSAALDGAYALNQAIVQIAGPSCVIDIRHFRAAVEKSSSLRTLLYRYDQFVLAQAQQSAACIAKHDVEARLCRWLLRARDLAGSDLLQLTQEFIAQMLGVRRTSVTLTAKNLHQAGLINYRRGRIQIVDLEGVQDSTCECYATVNAQHSRLLGRIPN